MAYRVVAKFDNRTVRTSLKAGPNFLGSDPQCEICLANPTVSRRHAVLTVGEGEIVLEDLGSTNGTLLNSKEIEKAKVRPGDAFVVGRVLVQLEELADDDLELGIGIPRVGFDPSGTLRVDLGELGPSGEAHSPLDRFALEQLPALLEQARFGLEPQEIGQRAGQVLHETMPVLSVEVAEIDGVDKGILYTSERDAAELNVAHDALPQWIESRAEGFQVRACFCSRSAGERLRPVVESLVAILAIAAGRFAEAASPDPFETFRSGVAERPQPISIDLKVRQIYDQAERVAQGDVGILIFGESGTGKEVLASFIHAASPRAQKNLVAINCASLPRDLLEAELFGVERGVATGVEARAGKFEAADEGTLFLDEIGDMAPETQAKILRVLQEKQVYRLGGHTPRPARARVVAATNRPIHKMINEGTFRNDLYHRIATWEVELPPLRHRKADIPNLSAHFLVQEARRHGTRPRGISRAALKALQRYRWPGNIRQLRNEIARAVLFLEKGELLDSSRLSPPIRGEGETLGSSLSEILENVERDEIAMALESCKGDTAATAEVLKISRPTLYRRIKSLGIEV